MTQRNQGAMRVPFGNIENVLPTQLPLKANAQKRSIVNELKQQLFNFYNQCRDLLRDSELKMNNLLSSIESQNTFLLNGLGNKKIIIQKIKQKLGIQLNFLSQYTFLDRKLFNTNRTTGTIQIKQFSTNNFKILQQKNNYIKLNNLKGLKLTNIILTQFQIEEIVKTLPHLQQLNLNQCAIDNNGAAIIARGLPKLTKLQLQWNQIGNEGAIQISKNLRKLKHLNLYLNDVGDEGAKSLVNNLKHIQILHLMNNQVTPEMLKYVFSTLASYNISND